MRRTVPPSAEIEQQIDNVLAVLGLGAASAVASTHVELQIQSPGWDRRGHVDRLGYLSPRHRSLAAATRGR